VRSAAALIGQHASFQQIPAKDMEILLKQALILLTEVAVVPDKIIIRSSADKIYLQRTFFKY
jgi:hypothetical protein